MGLSQQQTGPPNRSILGNLFAPVDTQKVLIPGESIIYSERRHWASLLQPLLETVAALLLITAISGGAAASGTLLAILLLCAFGLVAYRVKTGDWTKMTAVGGGLVFLFGVFVFGQFAMAFLAIIAVVVRFWYKVLFWFSYERLYITNRRIIIATAFLGSDINTMPLTRVTDISYKTTVPADILGYGILRVESAGQDQALSLIRFLEKPDEFYNTLIERTTAAVGSVTEITDDDDGSGTIET